MKRRVVAAANVFQELALENRYALEMLERLARAMLGETRARGGLNAIGHAARR